MKKLVSILLTVIMVLAMAASAFAAQEGTLTIKGTTEGKQYDLYRVFDLTQAGDNYSYTVNEDFADYFTEDVLGGKTPLEYIGNMQNDSTDLSKLAQSLLAYARQQGIAAVRVEGAAASTSVELEYGYYLLNPVGASGGSDNYATMFSLNTLSGNDTQIVVKGVYPEIDKTVNDDNETEDGDKTNEISIGKEMTFTLETEVPDMTGYNHYYFVVKDTLSKGLTFKSIESVTIGSTVLGKDAYTLDPAAPVTAEDGTTFFRIIFKNFLENYKDQAGDAIVIKYKAALNENAVIGEANENKVTLVYSNDPTYDYDGSKDPGTPDDPDNDPSAPTGETPESVTETFTTSLTLNKVDGKGMKLTGAAFRITGNMVATVVTTGDVYVENEDGAYWKLKDGTYTTQDPDGTIDGKPVDPDKYESTSVKYTKETKSTIITDDTEGSEVYAEAFVNDDGTLTFEGLGVGEYTISEIVVPNGYNKVDDFTVSIAFDETEKIFSATSGKADLTVTDNKISMSVVNKSGNVLPSTGGMGTTIFYIIGSVLVFGAAVLLIVRKRMNGSDR